MLHVLYDDCDDDGDHDDGDFVDGDDGGGGDDDCGGVDGEHYYGYDCAYDDV